MINKIVFIDMDGTICEFYDNKDRIHMTEFPDGFFLNKVPLKSMINGINTFFNSDYTRIILTACPNEEAKKEKNIWLDKNFNIDNRIILLYPNTDKSQAIFNFIKLNKIDPSNIYIIDDDLRILNSCEKLGIHCIHPSHILAMYEALQK